MGARPLIPFRTASSRTCRPSDTTPSRPITQSFCLQPRVGVAWSPHLDKTVIRAGFGMYNDLQDALGYRTDQNAPFNPTYSIAALTVSQLPISPQAPVPAKALLVPGGVQPDMKMPTLISYSVRVEQALDKNTSFTVGYVGSHGYHELIGIDANHPVPTICPGVALPGTISGYFPGAAGERSRSGRLLLHPRGSSKGQPHAGKYLDLVFRRQQQLQLAPGQTSTIVSATALLFAVSTRFQKPWMMGIH